ncbi:substrate-binding periplasmic protein [Spartinivicinus ruber]|uniref:substrate-binding periplasmic protein n=1 Tax=Spartinivicinus ruber TaxID=2683272 RepID=UPI0013D09BB2|nr:transporter substrate-binding domain-containing protein [Spartinivicinus ruber]
MKKIILILLIVLIALSIAGGVYWFFFSASATSQKKIVILSDPMPPWQFVDGPENKVNGINVDIASTIFKKLDIPVEFKGLRWEQVWERIEQGQAEAAMSVSRKDARKPFLWYPEEDLWLSEYVFFANKGTKKNVAGTYQDAHQLFNRIGILKGFSYNSELWELFPYKNGNTSYDQDAKRRDYNERLIIMTTPKRCMKKLALRQLDACLMDKSVGLYVIKEIGVKDKIEPYKAVLFSKGYPMPFIKKSSYPDLKNVATLFEKELKAMKANGEYDKIVNRWLH